MKRKHFLLKALLCSAVLAAVPFAAQSVSAESADAAAPMAVQADDGAATTTTFTMTTAGIGTTTNTTSYTTATLLTTTTTYAATLPATPPADGTSSTTSTTAFLILTDENGSTITTTTDDSTLTTTTEDLGNHLTDIDVKISADTIKVGEKAQITVGLEPADTTDFTIYTFVSSDPTIATVDDKGVVTALKEGDVTIYCTVHSSKTEIKLSVGAPEIYSVLVLDISTSMRNNDAIKAEREAATKFCQDILASNSQSHIAIITFGYESDTSVISDFSSDLGTLTGIISGITANSGSTYYTHALELADQLLSKAPDDAPRSIVFCSDGSAFDASKAIAEAEELKKKYSIYTLGFFHNSSSTSAAETLKTMASNEYSYSEVKDPKALTVQFAMIANNVAINVEGPTITKSVDLKVEPGTTTTPATTQPVQNAPAAAGVKTGDNDFIALYAVIALFGAAVVALTAKKRENN